MQFSLEKAHDDEILVRINHDFEGVGDFIIPFGLSATHGVCQGDTRAYVNYLYKKVFGQEAVPNELDFIKAGGIKWREDET